MGILDIWRWESAAPVSHDGGKEVEVWEVCKCLVRSWSTRSCHSELVLVMALHDGIAIAMAITIFNINTGCLVAGNV